MLSGTIILIGDLLYAWLWSKYNDHCLYRTIKNGTLPVSYVPPQKLIFRTEVKKLERLFNPEINEDRPYYHVICGKHGTGKTTIVKMAAKNVGTGVIYIDLPEDFEDLDKAFSKALNYKLEDISFSKQLTRKILGNNGGKFLISLL